MKKNKIILSFFPVRPPLYADKYLHKFIWNISNSKKIHLTFDDGPTPIITEKVLEILDTYKIKATFFTIGRNVERHPDIFKEIKKRGHAVGNHTYSHLNGWKTKYKEYVDDVELANLGMQSKLFRPAYGKIKPMQLRNIYKQYKIIMWDVLSGDYSSLITKEDCFNNIKKYTKEGSIIVFHDSIKASEKLLYALPKTIEYFLNKGYNFDKIYE